jgi:hypothetical protein
MRAYLPTIARLLGAAALVGVGAAALGLGSFLITFDDTDTARSIMVFVGLLFAGPGALCIVAAVWLLDREVRSRIVE